MADHQEPDRLYSEIGRLKVDLYGLKIIRDLPVMTGQGWILQGNEVAVVRQSALEVICHVLSRAVATESQRKRPVTLPFDRRGIHPALVFWWPQDGGLPQDAGPYSQP